MYSNTYSPFPAYAPQCPPMAYAMPSLSGYPMIAPQHFQPVYAGNSPYPRHAPTFDAYQMPVGYFPLPQTPPSPTYELPPLQPLRGHYPIPAHAPELAPSLDAWQTGAPPPYTPTTLAWALPPWNYNERPRLLSGAGRKLKRRRNQSDVLEAPSQSSFYLTPRPFAWRLDYRPDPRPQTLCAKIASSKTRLNEGISQCLGARPPINRLLSVHANFVWDLRLDFMTAYEHTSLANLPLTYNICDRPAIHPVSISEMRIVHDMLPWEITVGRGDGQDYIRVGDVLRYISIHLHFPAEIDDVYNSAISDEHRDRIARAKERRSQVDGFLGFKRIDFLERNLFFVGMDKNKDGSYRLRTASTAK